MPLNPELILGRIFNYLHVQSKEVDGFKTLENEIVHFKRIKFIDSEKYDEIRNKIDRVSKYPKEKEDVDKLYGIVDKEEYDRRKEALVSTEEFKMNNQRIAIEYLANHYYLPVIIPDQEKTNYLTHIINVESEIEFMEGLKNYLKTSDNVFSKFDWWMFLSWTKRLTRCISLTTTQKQTAFQNSNQTSSFGCKKTTATLFCLSILKAQNTRMHTERLTGIQRSLKLQIRKARNLHTANTL